MLGFRRAKQRPTPDAFWDKNAVVMDEMITLFDRTDEVLKLLFHGSAA